MSSLQAFKIAVDLDFDAVVIDFAKAVDELKEIKPDNSSMKTYTAQQDNIIALGSWHIHELRKEVLKLQQELAAVKGDGNGDYKKKNDE